MGTLEQHDDGYLYMLTVDGTQCQIQEIRPWSEIWFSHKFNGPGLNYEIGILIHKPHLIWVRGPTPPGQFNDATVFKQALMQRLPVGRKALADDGYEQEDLKDHCITKNGLDPPEIVDFKNRALSRHEKFNGILKKFGVLKQVFRHRDVLLLHEDCFKAACVVAMYELELGQEEHEFSRGLFLFDPVP